MSYNLIAEVFRILVWFARRALFCFYGDFGFDFRILYRETGRFQFIDGIDLVCSEPFALCFEAFYANELFRIDDKWFAECICSAKNNLDTWIDFVRQEVKRALWIIAEEVLPVARLKEERRTRSAALQRRLFGQFHILNACGETKDLYTLFAEAGRGEPPAGAGECAAPRLLQYAYLHGLQPVALAEFWQGASPRTELRRHGCYYPACKGKCEPILRHMLQGLDVEPNPLAAATPAPVLDIVWEDPWLVAINKPAGVLSAPGKTGQISLSQLVEARYPGSRYVHRLDMVTSGLLLFAKDAETYRQMQALFHRQAVRKRYAAWVEGILPSDEGVIELPLRPDPDDRPRQCVDFRHGKPAVTRYAVVARRFSDEQPVYIGICAYQHHGNYCRQNIFRQLKFHSAPYK